MLAACGDDSETPAERAQAKTVELNTQAAKLTKPTVHPPSEAPKKIVVKDLKEGTGPPVKPGDMVTIEYLGVDLAGKEKYSSWDDRELHFFESGDGDYFPGWDEGVKGMKVGGRREVFFPSNATQSLGPLFYVVDVLAIE